MFAGKLNIKEDFLHIAYKFSIREKIKVFFCKAASISLSEILIQIY